ncbi:hypothetical protein [Microlunatus parietis]|uniref:Uncharacterized protein n=1 Tax=Microlunatus parietis TaxID=682979 RepID=A0A7Y9I519_9ACTN|nr:hypothetical protein [Microlunatus parietis]NYE70436.1 hypothetical protein [Microlunatus parietis]
MVDGNVITVDAPLTNAIERRWGGGSMIPYTDPGRISEVGVEGILAVSDFDPSVIDTKMDNVETDPYYADEEHIERFVVFDNDAWARDIAARHLVYSLVQLGRGAKWVTVRDGTASEFVSVITRGRRYGYDVQGQLTLVENARLESARHGYAVTSRVPGPNVWTGGGTTNDFNTSEPHHRWSTGGLFDNVDARISIMDRAWLGSGHGWAGANYVAWNTRARSPCRRRRPRRTTRSGTAARSAPAWCRACTTHGRDHAASGTSSSRAKRSSRRACIASSSWTGSRSSLSLVVGQTHPSRDSWAEVPKEPLPWRAGPDRRERDPAGWAEHEAVPVPATGYLTERTM